MNLLNMNLLRTVIVLALSVTLPVVAYAGSTPKGKPFVEIQGQIVEINNDIASLEEEIRLFKEDVYQRFDTVETRLGAIDGKISSLEAKDSELAGQLTQIILDVQGNSEAIDALIVSIGTIQDQVNVIVNDIGLLELDAEANATAISDLETALDTLEADLGSAYDNLAAQVDGVAGILAEKVDIEVFADELNQLRVNIQQQLDDKQAALAISCSEDEFVNDIQSDGSFRCDAPSDGSGGVTRTTVYGGWVTIPRGYYGITGSYQQAYSCGTFGWDTCYRTRYTYGYRYNTSTAYASCPAGQTKASGTYDRVGGSITAQGSYGAQGHYVRATNYSTSTDAQIRAVVVCLAFS